MVFSSNIFLLYFLPIFLVLYYLADKKYKNFVALAASLFFYAWGAPEFIFVVLASITADFYLVQQMYKSEGKRQKLFLTASIILNIGLLAYFKYANFFVDNLNTFLNLTDAGQINLAQIALPIGISFFTFQKFTYTIDVYRGKQKPLDKIWDLFLYILLFPQLIAGPIVRYNEIADQLIDRSKNETVDNRITGMYRFIIGLAKKVLIANVMGAHADMIFKLDPMSISTATAWTGILAYTFQIYFDFSGYSDMAIGLGKMIGFKFPENFNNPYISRSISEFWRRWHITLGRWMKDYLYIPLGGNRVNSKFRLYFNLWFVFLISGLWHGASWTFIVWGAFHGIFLILDRLFLLKILNKSGKIISITLTFLVTVVGWVIFRSESMGFAFDFIEKLFNFTSGQIITPDTEFWTIFIIAVVFSFFTAIKPGLKIEQKVFYTDYTWTRYIIMGVLCMILLILSTASITSSGFNPFIYFRF
ncbi:MAG: MBOAT family protein [Bacteroidales bacterium]|nr:MBOAT family protein [Bacteroidales bacterium]